jgi:hypothetical protein
LLYLSPYAMTSEYRAKGPYFQVNRLPCGFLRQAGLLVAAHVLRLNVSDKALFEVRPKMLEIVALDSRRTSCKHKELQDKLRNELLGILACAGAWFVGLEETGARTPTRGTRGSRVIPLRHGCRRNLHFRALHSESWR